MKTPFLSIAVLAALSCSAASAQEAPSATSNAWSQQAENALAVRKAQKLNKKRAKNVILFVGDGLDPTTVAAARIFDGQSRGEDGEENYLYFETFPYVAYSKTYTTDFQVADSAGTASAMMTGVKTRSGVLSITGDAPHGDCEAALAHQATTLAELAKSAGLSVGVVSTAEITHATPGAVYAHAGNRDWAADSDMPDEVKAAGCKDIASQLLEFPYGGGVDLAFGGGRRKFLPSTMADPEYPEAVGRRGDGRDLTAEWAAKSENHRYVWNKTDFDAAPATSKLLALFEYSHMQFEADRAGDGAGEPSLAEMTAKAISMLSSDKDGYFLMVEAGKIDHAHHAGNAYRALTDTQAYAEAVRTARAMTSERDTLIIVTADHGHTLVFQGYPKKGNPILGVVKVENEAGETVVYPAGDEKPYTTLGYANGPGTIFDGKADLGKGRPALTEEEALAKDYRQQALIPTGGETHGGQDVPVYASGPRAYLLSGVIEQNYIFHVMKDALGL